MSELRTRDNGAARGYNRTGARLDVWQQTNTDLHRSLLDLRGTRSCAERVLLAFGELRQTNIDLGLAGNARIVANAADPFDTPELIVIRERINCVNSLAHWQIITESESIKEPRGRSRSQSYSQIALLHSHLFLHDQLTFADISGTDSWLRGSGRLAHLLHPRDRPDAKKVEHLQSTLTRCLRRYPTGIGGQSGERRGLCALPCSA